MYAQPYLQKYKGKDTRHDCPSCKAKLSFTQYLDGNTNKPIHYTVGKCNRESKCGYHYTPKQYFIDNPFLSPPLAGGRVGSSSSNSTNPLKPHTPSPLERAGVRSGGLVGSIPFRFVQKSASYRSNFVRFLCEILTDEQIHSIGENYALGATKNKEVIFWQIDINGKVRTGKIMQYNPETGRRLKHQSGAINWIHNKLKKSGTLPEDYNLQQCFFGEHLLIIYPDKPVAIVESEKSAIIASCIMPDLVWLAAGNLNGLSIEKCQVLKRRDVMLYPDLGAFMKWNQMVIKIQKQFNCKISISNLLEDQANSTDRENGLDIADYIISEIKSDNTVFEIQSSFNPILQ
ncbi:MAG: DUF6371 domain-containing protein [Paludibacter sp.]